MKKSVLVLLLCFVLLVTGCTSASPTATTLPGNTTDPAAQAPQDPVVPEEETEPGCSNHVDENDDDICDVCQRSVIIVIDFYAINDLHGKILDGSSHPGVDELTTYLENAQETENVVLISAGDMWQGSAESNITKGELMTSWMNGVEFDAMVLGNHEFDWGEEYIANNAQLAEFPLLAINVYDRKTNQQVEYCESSVIVEQDGVQIGIIGAIGDCYSSIAADHTRNIYFKTGQELTSLVKKESEALRAQGVDFIVYVLHDGLGENLQSSGVTLEGDRIDSYYDDALSDGYVDLVFEAHTHRAYLFVDEYGVCHMQHGGDNSGGISHAEIQIHAIDGTVEVLNTELIKTSEYENMEDSPLIDNLLDEYHEELAPVYGVIGYVNTSHLGDELRQKVADLYYMEGLLKWGEEYDIVLGGGYISIRDPGYLPRGEVTMAQLMGLFPFDNELVLCSVKGRDLKEKFFETDHRNYFICTGDYGEEVRANLDPNATYYIVVDTYTSTYAPNNLTEIERYGEPRYARDMLADFIANGGLN